jgi:glycosyltransferase involved in cell wall biosynthesis
VRPEDARVRGARTRMVFVVPADLARPTGGNRYDQELAFALEQLGVAVELRAVPGAWPGGCAADLAQLAGALVSPDPVLVDGLLACGAPGQVRDAVRRGCRVHVLVHMPLALDPGLAPRAAAARDAQERAALHAASGVLATSAWTAAHLRARHGLTTVRVATPGTHPTPPATGSTPPLIRQLAAVSPVKDQLTVVAALARARHGSWTAELTGALDVDPAYTAAVRAAVDRHGLCDRIRLTGPLVGGMLEKAWDATDLLLLPSRAETWGMAVTEALGRGIPAVVGRGTGAQEALGRAPDGELPGALVPAGVPEALGAAVLELLGQGRAAARGAALARRQTLSSWRETALAVREALT